LQPPQQSLSVAFRKDYENHTTFHQHKIQWIEVLLL
jgi:hypothetical protein